MNLEDAVQILGAHECAERLHALIKMRPEIGARLDKLRADDPVALERVLGWLRQRDAEVERLQKALSNTAKGAEKQRQRDHHDVLCFVLKAHVEDQLRNDGQGPLTKGGLGLAVEMSRYAADLAYPPPKAFEGFSLNAGSIAKPQGGVVIARNDPPKAEEP